MKKPAGERAGFLFWVKARDCETANRLA